LDGPSSFVMRGGVADEAISITLCAHNSMGIASSLRSLQ
jgi:hypothetical protein